MSEPLIEMYDITFAYPGASRPVFQDFHFQLLPEQHIGLTGPNGCGKTTLLHLIMGLLRPQAGKIVIFGQEVSKDKDFVAVRQKVGLLFQNADDQLFCPTVFEDVAFGPLNLSVPAGEIPHRVEKALSDTGLDNSIRSRSSHHLSLGERRRVSLAAVLAMEPAVLGMDEPTSNLDPRNRRHLIEVISGLEATLIIATHDLELVLDVCARTILMDRGKIWADGETRSMLSEAGLMEKHGMEVPLSLKSGMRS